MLQCKKCQVELFESSIDRHQGDWIIICSICSAKNIIAPVLVNKAPLKMLQVIGWRE